MQPQEQTTPIQLQSPYMQSRVQYLGRTIFGGGLGLLEWSSDSHIRLFAIDPATGQSKGVIFECLPSQIRRAKASIALLELRLDDKKYLMDFSASATTWLSAEGALGLFMANKKEKQSGVQWWVDNLKNQGIEVKQFSMGKVFKITLFVMLGFFGLVFLIAILGARR